MTLFIVTVFSCINLKHLKCLDLTHYSILRFNLYIFVFFYRNCSGTRQWKRRQFIENDPPVLIISVSYPSQCGLELGDIPEDVTVLGKR